MSYKMGYIETPLGKLPDNWIIDTMENALESIIDYRGKTPKKSNHGIVTLSAKSVKNGYIDYSNAYYISPITYKKFMVRGFPKVGDILMTTEAPLGYIAKLDRNDIAVAQRLLTLRGKNVYLDNGYLMYYLMSKIGQHQLHSKATGTTVTGIKQAEFRKVLISIPPLPEQKAITVILACLDEMIELNNRTNQVLEEMAQAIFKHWFVDFEFPNEDGQPYKSSGGAMVDSELGKIPEGWRVGTLSELTTIFNGYSYKGSDLQESNDAMLTIKNFARCGGFKTDGFKTIKISEKMKPNHYVEKFDVLVAHTDITQNADIIGNAVIVLTDAGYDKLIMSMDLVKIVSTTDFLDSFLLYLIINSNSFKNHALGYVTGTTVLHLSKKTIPSYKLPIPANTEIFTKASRVIKPLITTISQNIDCNQCLDNIRNALLPKLISGELRVPVEEVV